jgi:hypothetical protein
VVLCSSRLAFSVVAFFVLEAGIEQRQLAASDIEMASFEEKIGLLEMT